MPSWARIETALSFSSVCPGRALRHFLPRPSQLNIDIRVGVDIYFRWTSCWHSKLGLPCSCFAVRVSWLRYHAREDWFLNYKQRDRQCTYNIILRCVRTNFVVMEKHNYYIFWICVCRQVSSMPCSCPILSSMACSAVQNFSVLPHKRHD